MTGPDDNHHRLVFEALTHEAVLHEHAWRAICGQVRRRLPKVAVDLPHNASPGELAEKLVATVAHHREWRTFWSIFRDYAPSRASDPAILGAIRALSEDPTIAIGDVRWKNPYRRLMPYSEADGPLYHPPFELPVAPEGLRRFHAVLGPPGCGKSSFVRAYLLPRLREVGETHIIEVDCSHLRANDPRTFVLDRLIPPGDGATRPSTLAEAQEVLLSTTGKQRITLLLDQFEYIVNRAITPLDAVLEGLTLLSDDPTLRIDVLLTMRTEAVEACKRHSAFYALLSQNSSRIRLLDRPQIKLAIARPALTVGAVIDEALVDALVVDLDDRIQFLSALQITLFHLYESAHQRASNTGAEIVLSLDLYGESARLERAIDELVRGAIEAAQHHGGEVAHELPPLFAELVEPVEDSTELRFARRLAPRGDRSPGSLASALIDSGVLHTPFDTKGEAHVQLAHDILFEQWDALALWLKRVEPHFKALLRIERSFRHWQEIGTARKGLLRRVDLDEERGFSPEIRGKLSDEVQDYIRRSARSLRVRLWLVALLGALVLLAATILIAWLLHFRQASSTAKLRLAAEEEAREFEAHRSYVGKLANDARRNLWAGHPSAAVRLAVEAGLEASEDPVENATAVQVLLDVLRDVAPHEHLPISEYPDVDEIKPSKDEQRLLIAARNRALILDRRGPFEQTIFEDRGVRHVDWSSDENHVLVAADSGLSIIDLHEGTTTFLTDGVDRRADFAPDDASEVLAVIDCPPSSSARGSKQCATVFVILDGMSSVAALRYATRANYAPSGAIDYAEGNRIVRWSRQTGEETEVFATTEGRVDDFLVSADGRVVLASVHAAWESPQILLHLGGEKERTERLAPPQPEDRRSSWAFAPGGSIAFIGYHSGKVIGWSISDPGRSIPLPDHESEVTELAFSPDGRVLYSAGHDRVVHAVDVESATAKYYRGHDLRVTAIAPLREGAFLTGGWSDSSRPSDHPLRLWSGDVPVLPVELFSREPGLGALPQNDHTLAISSDGAEVAALIGARIVRFVPGDGRRTISRAPFSVVHLAYHGRDLHALDPEWNLWQLDGPKPRLVKSLNQFLPRSAPSFHGNAREELLAMALRGDELDLVLKPGIWIRGIPLAPNGDPPETFTFASGTGDADTAGSVRLQPRCADEIDWFRVGVLTYQNIHRYAAKSGASKNVGSMFRTLSADCRWSRNRPRELTMHYLPAPNLSLTLSISHSGYIDPIVCDDRFLHCVATTPLHIYYWTLDRRELIELAKRMLVASPG